MIQFGKMSGRDFGPFKEVEFDWSLPGLTLIDGDNHDTTSAGSNGCLVGETLIDCPRDLRRFPKGIPIGDLVGERPWVYAWSDGRIVIRRASRVVLTKKSAPVIRVMLSKYATRQGAGQGEKYIPPQELVGTADHPVLLSDGQTWRALGDLRPGDRLCSMYRRGAGGWRTLIHWTGRSQAVSEQQFVCRAVHGPRFRDKQVHHLNGNPFDHSIGNLEWKNRGEHLSQHTSERNRAGKLGWQRTGIHPRGMKGKHHTAETKARMRAANSRRAQSVETRRKRSETMRALFRAKREREAVNHTVLSVEPAGVADVYDITVPGADSFIANGVVVHNSGKSHLPKLLSWIVFGETIEGDRYEEVIRRGAKEAVGAQEIIVDGEAYLVTRTRTKKQGTLTLTHAGKDVTRPVMTETQKQIEALLGLDFRTFRSTVLYGQDDHSRFAMPRTTDSERKAILFRVLRLDGLDLALEFVKAERTAAERERDAAAARIVPLETALQGQDLQGIKDDLQENREQQERLKVRTAGRQALVETISEAEATLEESGDLEGDLRALRQQQRELSSKIAGLRQTSQAETRAASEKLDRVAAFVDEGKCPECGTPTGAETVAATIESLKRAAAAHTSKALKADKERAAAVKALSSAEEDERELEQEVKDRDAIRDGLEAARRDLVGIDGVAEQVRTLQQTAERLSKRLAAVGKERKRLAGEIDAAKGERDRAEEAVSVAEFWVRGFGNQGLRSQILDDIIGELADLTNGYLEVLSDGDVRVAYDTEAALKGGGKRDKFSIVVDVEGAGNVQPSGGQWRKITIAADLALMDLVARRERAAIDLLIMDEALDGLDATGQARVVDLLTHLRAKRHSIVVISHAPAMSDVFERTFRAVKEGGVSILEAA